MMHAIAFVGVIAPLALALAPPIPSPTDPLVGGVDLRGFTPKPTTPAVHPDLRKRQNVGSLIGYVSQLTILNHKKYTDTNVACT
jgi:hypothetical protein